MKIVVSLRFFRKKRNGAGRKWLSPLKLVRPRVLESKKKTSFFFGNLENPEILKYNFFKKNKYFWSGFFLMSRSTSESHESEVYHCIFVVHGGTPPSPEYGIALAGSSITQSSDITRGRSNFKPLVSLG